MRFLKGYDKEVRAILGILTFKRLSNLFFSYTSHLLSKILGRNLHKGSPAYITLESTNSCNLSCPECVTGMNGLHRPVVFSEPKLAEGVLNVLGAKALIVNLYFQGEPLLNPTLFDAISLASKKKLYSIISTNAQNLNKEKAVIFVQSGLKKIIVSLDGITQETYSKYRVRGQLTNVLEGIENLVQARKEQGSSYPIIEVQFIVFRFNEHEINDARKLVYTMGCDRFVLKTAQFYNKQRAAEWRPTNAKFQRYQQEEPLQVKTTATRGCKKMWSSMVVCAGGEVALCCMDKNAVYSPGNVNETDALSLWKSEAMKGYRTRISKGNYLDICTNCPLKG